MCHHQLQVQYYSLRTFYERMKNEKLVLSNPSITDKKNYNE